MIANTPSPRGHVPENPPVAAAEASAVAPMLVSGVERVARSRLLTETVDTLLVAGNHEETLLRNYVMGIGYQ